MKPWPTICSISRPSRIATALTPVECALTVVRRDEAIDRDNPAAVVTTNVQPGETQMHLGELHAGCKFGFVNGE